MAVKAQQTACGICGRDHRRPPVDVVVEKLQTLPTPVVQTPLRECERRVTVSDVVHGATVTLMRSAGPEPAGMLRSRRLWMGSTRRSSLGETISARQELSAHCQLKSADADAGGGAGQHAGAGGAVMPPLCAGNTTVVLTGLDHGRAGDILADGGELGMAESPVDGTYDFLVPPLVGGTIDHRDPGAVRRVERCRAPACSSTRPRRRCRRRRCTSRCTNAALRCECRTCTSAPRLRVSRRLLGAPIGERTADAAEVDVTVAPLLIATTRSSRCSAAAGSSARSPTR